MKTLTIGSLYRHWQKSSDVCLLLETDKYFVVVYDLGYSERVQVPVDVFVQQWLPTGDKA